MTTRQTTRRAHADTPKTKSTGRIRISSTTTYLWICLFHSLYSRSETDTEVIAHLVGLELDADPSIPLKVALARTVAKLDGTWGLAVIAHER